MNFSKNDILGIKIISISLLVIMMISVLALWLRSRPQPDSNNCFTDEVYRNVVLLVDNTDIYSENQKRYIDQLREHLNNDLELNDRLTIYVMNNNSSFSPVPSLSICRPPSQEDVSQFNSNPRRIQEIFESVYAAPIARSLEDSQLDAVASQSPIIEFIEGIVNNLTSNGIYEIDEFILISDLFQNTAQLNHYRVPENTLDQVPEYYQRMFENIGRTNVFRQSTSVQITILIREPIANRQSPRHMLFWEQAFRAFGVDLYSENGNFRVEPIR